MKQHYFSLLKKVVLVFLLCGIASFLMYHLYRQISVTRGNVLTDQLQELAGILTSIDRECGISQIAHDRSYIDFLTIAEFSGAYVGALHLMYPEKWQGPYLTTNYRVQDRLYEIIKTASGYYIVPGDGVILPNGKIMGKDVVISYDTDPMKQPDLSYKGRSLIVKLPLKHVVDLLEAIAEDGIL